MAVHLASGCAAAFGLLATADVLAALLRQGPTPARLLESLPALAVVVTAFAARGALDVAVDAVVGMLRPRVMLAADGDAAAALAGVRLLAFEDAEFRELARKVERFGLPAIEGGVSATAHLLSSGVSLAAALVATALLSPWLVLTLALAAVADASAVGKVSTLRYGIFLGAVTRDMRRSVIKEVATSRGMALERNALNLRQRLLAEYRRASAELAREEVQLARSSATVRLIGRAAAGCGAGVAYLTLGVLLYTGSLQLALAGTAMLSMRAAALAMSNTVKAVNSLYEGSFYIDMYRRLFEEAAARRPTRSAVRAPARPSVIRLENVSFTYPGQDTPAIHHLSLAIRCGEVVALVGENGSGKSTLAKIIAGLYPVTSGAVFWDDVNLATADEESVHDRIAVIAQNPAQWPMTAFHNITVGRVDQVDPDRSAWQSALRRSGADDVLATLPHGADTLLSRYFQNAQDLSSGQWQRLGVARGLYRAAYLLIADEPTAALDAKAEFQVLEALQHRAANADDAGITLVVTHRLANIRTADRILVLDRGRLVEHGTHTELTAADGLYRSLYDAQSRPVNRADQPLRARNSNETIILTE
ncbi:ABC transporter ATP-binding protein [Nonomuraea sp. B12E4]